MRSTQRPIEIVDILLDQQRPSLLGRLPPPVRRGLLWCVGVALIFAILIWVSSVASDISQRRGLDRIEERLGPMPDDRADSIVDEMSCLEVRLYLDGVGDMIDDDLTNAQIDLLEGVLDDAEDRLEELGCR